MRALTPMPDPTPKVNTFLKDSAVDVVIFLFKRNLLIILHISHFSLIDVADHELGAFSEKEDSNKR
jgi:hypothetical protein